MAIQSQFELGQEIVVSLNLVSPGRRQFTRAATDNAYSRLLAADAHAVRGKPSYVVGEDRALKAHDLDEKYNLDGGGEHPAYTRADWRVAVACDETTLGYWLWLEEQVRTETPALPEVASPAAGAGAALAVREEAEGADRPDFLSAGEGEPSVRTEHGLACPNCRRDECLEVAATVWVRLIPGGANDQLIDRSLQWEMDSPCKCVACGWSGNIHLAQAAALYLDLCDAYPIGTQVMSIQGEEGHGSDDTEHETGPEARGKIVDILAGQEHCYVLAFPNHHNVVVVLSRAELDDQKRYLTAPAGERV